MELARKSSGLWWLAFGAVAAWALGARRSRWRAQLERVSSTQWTATAPAWGVPLVRYAESVTGVPAALLAALIRTESAWRVDAVSRVGAIGLTQLMPKTAASLGVDPHDVTQNVLGGARYLAAQLERFDDVALALAAYNAGPHRVVQYQGIPPFAETQAYVARILSRLQ